METSVTIVTNQQVINSSQTPYILLCNDEVQSSVELRSLLIKLLAIGKAKYEAQMREEDRSGVQSPQVMHTERDPQKHTKTELYSTQAEAEEKGSRNYFYGNDEFLKATRL